MTLNGSFVTGTVDDNVQGVPAHPVNSFVWDGTGSTPIQGSANLRIDPVANTGTIEAEWQDENGSWPYTQTAFGPTPPIPDHVPSLRLDRTAFQAMFVSDDPISTNVYLHGNTRAGGPVLPTIFNLLATWGPAVVTLNSAPFENSFDGPMPEWVGHSMISVGARNPDGTVTANVGTTSSSTSSSMTPQDRRLVKLKINHKE